MDQSIKNYLGYALVLALIVFSYAAVIYVRTYSSSIEPSLSRSFSVSGEGKVVGKPDVAQFAYSIITEGGTNLAELQKQHDAKSAKVNNFVKKSGVTSDDIKTQNYNVEPRYQSYNCYQLQSIKPCPPPQIVGYTIRETVSVKVRDFEKVGDILGGAVSNGANNISGPTFTIDDPTKVENAARVEAITKAKSKAESIADAGGFNLGRLLSISEGGGFIPRFESFAKADGGVLAAPSAPVIEPGSEEIRVTVTLTYEIR